MRRASLPGTDHSSTIHRDEKSILEAIQHAPSVRKLKTGGFTQTGPTPWPRLQLRPATIAGTQKCLYEARLFIGANKRRIKIYPWPTATGDDLVQELEAALARRGVVVEVWENPQAAQSVKYPITIEVAPDRNNEQEEQEMPVSTNGQKPLLTDDTWTCCELVYEAVKQVRALTAQEVALQTQLNNLRKQIHEVKTSTLEALSQALQALPAAR